MHYFNYAQRVCLIVFSDVNEVCNNAQKEFKDTAIESLIKLLNSDEYGYKKKNNSIWTLGQIGDPKELPYLRDITQENLVRNFQETAISLVNDRDGMKGD